MRPVKLLLAVHLLLISRLLASDGADERASLKGIGQVEVIVETIDPVVEAKGLSTSAIKTDVQLRLRQSGIPVTDKTQDPFLYVNVNVILSPSGMAAYNISVSFNQSVSLQRSSATLIPGAATWSVGGIGIVSQDNLRKVRESLQDYLDKFCNAYLSANPK